MRRHTLLALAAGTLASLPGLTRAQSVPTTLTYQGRLEKDGALYDGSAQVEITAYDAQSGGNKIGAQVQQAVTVSSGLFTVEYDPGVQTFESNVQVWLNIAIKENGNPAWTSLPRQKVTAAPFSSATRGLYVTGSAATARVGIGGQAPAGAKLSVREATNASSLINIDSGLNAGQTSGFQLADRGSAQWLFGKSSSNGFFFDRTTANTPVNIYIGTTTLADDPDWSTEVVIHGKDVPTGINSTSGIIFINSVEDRRWSIGQQKDGTFSFLKQGAGNNFVSVPALEIRGGSDIAEPYDVAPSGDTRPAPGMVVSIDPDRVGKLRVAAGAYDRMVAGIVSGANGVNTGLTLTQSGSVADGQLPIAKVGRVWCLIDADAAGPVHAGDLLTTSDTPGHAQKVDDFARSQGAILGKAMSGLGHGRGYVLVLVGLQ